MPVKEASPQELAEFPFEEKSIKVGKNTFRFRELSVLENDKCADDAKDGEGRIDGRLMMRLMVIASSVEPKLSAKLLGSMPARVYAKIYDVVNDLQNPDTLDQEDDEEGNA